MPQVTHARSLDGSSQIVFDNGAVDFTALAPCSLAVIAKMNEQDRWQHFCIAHAADTTVSWGLGVNPNEFLANSMTSAVNHFSSFNMGTADGWALLAMTVAVSANDSGGVRFHKYVYGTDTWTHANGNLNSTATADTPDRIKIGAWRDTELLNGEVICAAIWESNLSDAALEALTDSFGDWRASSPAWAVLLNQTSTATSITDATGGGGDQTELIGTSVVTAGLPTFDDGAGTLFFQALDAQVGAASVIFKQAGKALRADAGATPVLVRSVAKALRADAGAAALITKRASITLAQAAVGAAAALTGTRIAILVLDAAVGAGAAITKQARKIVAAECSASAIIAKQANKPLRADVGAAAALTPLKAIFLTITAQVGAGASIVKRVGKALAVNVGVAPSITKRAGKVLAAQSGAAAAIVKMPGKALAAGAGAAAAILKGIGKIFGAEVGGSPSILLDGQEPGIPPIGRSAPPATAGIGLLRISAGSAGIGVGRSSASSAGAGGDRSNDASAGLGGTRGTPGTPGTGAGRT